MRMRQALARSKNLVSIRILQQITPQYAQDYITRFGFDADKHPAYLTMALGAGSVTPWQMVGAYSVFANGGYRINPHLVTRITDDTGKVLAQAKPAKAGDESNRVIDARNAFIIGMGALLWAGIGETLRVSLAADPVEEVKVGFDMLKSLGLRHRGVNIIACPSCARQGFDVIRTVETLEARLAHIATPMSLSIIGGVVNGPGEALMTDVGFTGGGKGAGMVYLAGKADHKMDNDRMVEHIVELVERRAAELESAGVAPT